MKNNCFDGLCRHLFSHGLCRCLLSQEVMNTVLIGACRHRKCRCRKQTKYALSYIFSHTQYLHAHCGTGLTDIVLTI